METKKVQRIKLIIAICVIMVTVALILFRYIKYQKEGEKNMPFNLSQIIIISTAEKDEIANIEQSENTLLGNFNIIQNNDIYISIKKNDQNAKNNETIKNITIENIEIVETPKTGKLNAYMPNSTDKKKYIYSDQYLVSQSLTYRGAEENNYKTLQISANGGDIGISFANKEVGQYISGDDTEVTYNGKMLSKLGLTNEDVKSKIAFDLIIELSDQKKYLGRINLDLSCNQLVEEGKSQTQITDFSNVIFKRTQ